MKLAWRAAAGSDRGRVRRTNEDSYRIDPDRGLFLVADGMGGHAAGEVASRLAADAVLQVVEAEIGEDAGARPGEALLEQACAAAHSRIVEACEENPACSGMGTTLTACLISPSGRCLIAHLGDSRVYLQREDDLRCLTRDHTWVQREVDAGRLDAAIARTHARGHILLRVLSEEPDAPDIVAAHLEPGDRLLLCTDGLHGMVDDDEIGAVMRENASPDEIVGRLIAAANAAGGRDNVTVVVIELLDRTF